MFLQVTELEQFWEPHFNFVNKHFLAFTCVQLFKSSLSTNYKSQMCQSNWAFFLLWFVYNFQSFWVKVLSLDEELSLPT